RERPRVEVAVPRHGLRRRQGGELRPHAGALDRVGLGAGYAASTTGSNSTCVLLGSESSRKGSRETAASAATTATVRTAFMMAMVSSDIGLLLVGRRGCAVPRRLPRSRLNRERASRRSRGVQPPTWSAVNRTEEKGSRQAGAQTPTTTRSSERAIASLLWLEV